jgi:hypothetical protein
MTTQRDEKSPARGEADEERPPEKDLLHLVEEYVNDLRKIVEKIRRRLH